MSETFLEINLDSNQCVQCNIKSRDEIEDAIDDALKNAELGEVTGGGGGGGRWNIDVDVATDRFEEALRLLRSVLRRINVPSSTMIKRYEPTTILYDIV